MNKFIVTREVSRQRESAPTPPPAEASFSVVLRSLQDVEKTARLDAFASEGPARATGGEVYEVLFEVKGPWDKMPSHAVYAVWEISVHVC